MATQVARIQDNKKNGDAKKADKPKGEDKPKKERRPPMERARDALSRSAGALGSAGTYFSGALRELERTGDPRAEAVESIRDSVSTACARAAKALSELGELTKAHPGELPAPTGNLAVGDRVSIKAARADLYLGMLQPGETLEVKELTSEGARALVIGSAGCRAVLPVAHLQLG